MNGAKYLLKRFDNSFVKALQFAYPTHKWHFWKLAHQISYGFWNEMNNQRDFMEWLRDDLGFKDMTDWYKMTSHHIKSRGASGLLIKYGGSPAELLQRVYPEHSWKKPP